MLADGTNTYLYGPTRIGEQQPGGFAYHLPDALGSVRQLANASGAVTLTRSYEPFGSTLSSAGGGTTAFQFAGEARDASGLIYLRARYYASSQGRFVSRDSWQGDFLRPQTLNGWSYVEGNPVNLTDPSGHTPWPQKNKDELKRLSGTIIASAKRHNSQGAFTDEAFAALMAAHLNRESRLGAGNTIQSYGYDQLADFLGRTINYDASTGIANIRPRVALEIQRGFIPGVSGTFEYEIYGCSFDSFVNDEYMGVPWTPSEGAQKQFLFQELQDEAISLEYLAANIERGIDRATAPEFGIVPSIFNIGNWLWHGVQTRNEFLVAVDRGDNWTTHGAALVGDMPTAFQVLGLSMTPYNAYNPDEADFVDGSFFLKRKTTLLCQFQTPPVLYKNNPRCAESHIAS